MIKYKSHKQKNQNLFPFSPQIPGSGSVPSGGTNSGEKSKIRFSKLINPVRLS